MPGRPSQLSFVPIAAILLLALLAGLAGPPPVRAQPATEPVGEVLIQRGLIKVRRGRAERIYEGAGVRIPVYETDVIHTGADTRATLTLQATKETVEIYADSHLRVAEYKPESGEFDLNIGKAFFSIARKLFGERDVHVNTPQAVVGVKGTEFVVGAREDESYVMTVDGVVGVAAKAEPEREVSVTPDQLYFVTETERPAAPVKVDPGQRARILKEDGLESLRDAAGLTRQEVEEPLGLYARIGFGEQDLRLPFRLPGVLSGSRTFTATVTTLSAEFELFGPVSVDAVATAGQFTQANSTVSALDANSVSGRLTGFALLVGVRETVAGAVNLSLHAGPFGSWARVRADLDTFPSETRTLNVRGNELRGAVGYVFENGTEIGLATYYGIAQASGSEIDFMKSLGLKVDDAVMTETVLTFGIRY